ncbi:MAG: SRPBCC domain-containing protein [Chitinophagales bacterium]
MKKIITIVTIMATTTIAMAQEGKATTVKETFNRETSVSININADPSIIWAILTNAADYPRWNSTVTSLEGTIALNEKIYLKSVLDEKRIFKLKVKEFVPAQSMVWGDSKGSRTYTLTKSANGTTTFAMSEKIGGLMFPMYAKYIPPFDATFEQFAADLKKEAEAIMNSKN